jgi:hypothetical protein
MRQPRRAPAAAVPRQPTGPGPLTLLWRSIRSNVPSFAWHGALALMSTLIMGAGAQFCPAQRLWSSMVRYCGVTDYFYLGGGADTPVHYSE